MPTIQVAEQEIYYAARGSYGAPFVLIHGAGDNHLCWNGQLAALAHVARGYALDLPGHGRSRGAGCKTILDYALATREFLDALQIERAVILGVSMGGAIAQTMALEFPERILGLGLIGTGAKLSVAPAFLRGLEDDFENTARELAQNYFFAAAPLELSAKSAASLLATGAVVTRADFAACDAFDARARVGEIRAPTLIVCGAQDRLTPPRYAEFLAQRIAGAELRLIENAGHLAMLEQAKEFNRILKAWMARHEWV